MKERQKEVDYFFGVVSAGIIVLMLLLASMSWKAGWMAGFKVGTATGSRR